MVESGSIGVSADLDLSKVTPWLKRGNEWTVRGFTIPQIQAYLMTIVRQAHGEFFRNQAGPEGAWAPLKEMTMMLRAGRGPSAKTLARQLSAAGGDSKLARRLSQRDRLWLPKGASWGQVRRTMKDWKKTPWQLEKHLKKVFGGSAVRRLRDIGTAMRALGGMQILVRKGWLRQAAVALAGSNVAKMVERAMLQLRVLLAYAGFIEGGTRRMVKRPFMGVRDADVQKMADGIARFLADGAAPGVA